MDPYRQFEELNTHMRYNRFLPGTHILRLEEIISHFAAYIYTPEDVEEECIVVRSLDRVSHRKLLLQPALISRVI